MWLAHRQDVCVKGIEIDYEVDASAVEHAHALVMIRFRVDVIDSEGIGAQGLHEGGISSALFGVDERVICNVPECVSHDACFAIHDSSRRVIPQISPEYASD